MAARLDRLPVGSYVVVRAFPSSGLASSAALGAALDRALGQVLSESVNRPHCNSSAKEGQVAGR